jgi:hypothetical protein
VKAPLLRLRAEFILRSTELRQPLVRECEFLRRVDDGGVPEKILVIVEPHISGYLYASTTDLDRVVLAPRHKGAVLYPDVSEWPCHVHICIPKEGGDWEQGPFRIADWGVIEKLTGDGSE